MHMMCERCRVPPFLYAEIRNNAKVYGMCKSLLRKRYIALVCCSYVMGKQRFLAASSTQEKSYS